jgi:hypothetical protein
MCVLAGGATPLRPRRRVEIYVGGSFTVGLLFRQRWWLVVGSGGRAGAAKCLHTFNCRSVVKLKLELE